MHFHPFLIKSLLYIYDTSKSFKKMLSLFFKYPIHIYLSVYLYICLFICLSIYLSIYLSICLSIYLRNTEKVIIPADKTRNLYKMEKDNYNKHLTENTAKAYKKSNMNKVNKLNLEAKKKADKLSISDRVDRLQNNEAYITIKDHKENLQTNPTFRLINPSKTSIGKISKKILYEINEKITSSIGVN